MTQSPQVPGNSELIELKMTAITEGLPKRDELRGEQTILTYCEQVGTWGLSVYESGWDDFDAGFALGVSHWLDITGCWPGVIAQVAAFHQQNADALSTAEARIEALEAERDVLRVEAAELVVAEYATSAATARAETAEATIASLRGEVEWQPIETAPKDGTFILVYQTGVLEPSQTVVAYGQSWSDDGWWMCCDGKNTELPLRGPEPTHWRPLPASPAARSALSEVKP